MFYVKHDILFQKRKKIIFLKAGLAGSYVYRAEKASQENLAMSIPDRMDIVIPAALLPVALSSALMFAAKNQVLSGDST